MEWITTSTILQGLRNFQDLELWERFVDRFQPPIVRFARSLGVPPQDAEDVAQETLLAFIQAYRDGRYDRERGRLSRWLFGIAYRQSLAQRRHGSRPESSLPPGDALPDATVSDLWERHWERSLIRACLEGARDEFDPQIFGAFEQVVRHGRTPAEAAEALGITVKAVYNAKHRVLKRVRELRSALEAIE